MKSLLLTTCTTLALTLTATSAFAVAQRLGPGDKQVTFSNLSMTNGNPDDGTCAKRYGAGFTTKEPEGNSTNTLQRTTDKGHDIIVIAIGGSVSEGIFSIENEYEVVFPDDPDKTPIDMELAATGLVGSKEAYGVFSDGTCRGNIHLIVKDS